MGDSGRGYVDPDFPPPGGPDDAPIIIYGYENITFAMHRIRPKADNIYLKLYTITCVERSGSGSLWSCRHCTWLSIMAVPHMVVLHRICSDNNGDCGICFSIAIQLYVFRPIFRQKKISISN